MVGSLEHLWELRRPAVMGILNVTPDSFSDGGRYLAAEDAVAHGLQLLAEGADVLDVGGESTRPGAQPVSEATERQRVLPVIAELLRREPHALVSIDTRRASVAAAALAAGAVLVNDVSAAADPHMLEVVASRGAGIVLMHMRGEPATMQQDTRYRDVVAEVHEYLGERARAAEAAGVSRHRIFLDPGIGFGKDVAGNLRLLHALPELVALGYPVVVGASRKSFIGALTGASVEARLPGSLAALNRLAALPRTVVRVHDVGATVQFLTVAAAIEGAV